MNTISVILLIPALIFSGCATLMTGGLKSDIDPYKKITINDKILVSTGKDNLKTRYYFDKVKEALLLRGFKYVYSENEYLSLQDNRPIIKIYLGIHLEKDVSTYQYNGANYGLKDSGVSNTNCYGFGNMATCSTTNQQTYGVTGYSQKTGYLEGHYFHMYWLDMSTEEQNTIMRVMGSSYMENCSENEMFNFLIEQTVARIDFDKPIDIKYEVEMPDGYDCQ